MHLDYSFFPRFLLWSACSVYLWRRALAPRNREPRGRFERSLGLIGALLTSWLAFVALGRGLGLFQYLF